ncbi:hypothetical protein QCA50_015255 [Cerrena zonata]|uniref:Uncharacterized protein n=1 Tax=Cerrena zonata TaxID=2478898 RepID=A0AAW0FK87_9APHY
MLFITSVQWISSSLVISHFKSIILQGALAPIIGLLSHVVNVEKLHLTLTSFPSDNIISLPRIVRNALPSIENISPTALNHRVQFTIDTMQTDRVLDFRLSIWTNASPVISKDPFSRSPDIWLSFCPDNLATTLTIAQQLSEQLSHYLVPATHARFRISGGCGRPGSEMLILRYMAETLTHVTHIDLVLGDIRDLSSTNIIAALPSLFMSPHSDTRTALFPKLMVLRIDANMLLGCSRVQPLCAFFKSLHAVLANRYELGFKLQSLEFDASRCINLPLTFDGADPLGFP